MKVFLIRWAVIAGTILLFWLALTGIVYIGVNAPSWLSLILLLLLVSALVAASGINLNV